MLDVYQWANPVTFTSDILGLKLGQTLVFFLSSRLFNIFE